MQIKDVKVVNARIPSEKRDPKTGKIKKTSFRIQGVSLEFDDLHSAFNEDTIVMENKKEVKAHGTKIFWSEKHNTFSLHSASCPIRNKLDDTWEVTHTSKHANMMLTTSTKNGGIGRGLNDAEFQNEYPQLKHYLPIIADCWIEHEKEREEAALEKVAA